MFLLKDLRYLTPVFAPALVVGLLGLGTALGNDPFPVIATQVRRPVSAALLAGDSRLVVANRRSGTLSLIDCRSLDILGEFPFGERLAHLVALDERRLLLADEERHELIALALENDRIRELCRIRTGRCPVWIAVNDVGNRALVACLWSRQLDVINLAGLTTGQPAMARLRSIPLSYNPREVLWLLGAPFAVVADAFGGDLGLVDIESGAIRWRQPTPGVELRGLARSADRGGMSFAFARYEAAPPITEQRLRSGSIISDNTLTTSSASLLRLTPLDLFRRPPTKGWHGSQPAEPRADATALVSLAGHGNVVALGGVDRLTIGDRLLGMGKRPVAIVADRAEKRLYVVNQLDDSIKIVELEDAKTVRLGPTIALGPSPPESPADRGERLFYNARLSAGGWMSCHSCHPDGHTTGRLADTPGDGSFGAPKRTLTLRGTRLTDRWAWNGEIKDLSAQVEKSLRTTLHAKNISPGQVGDLTAFLHTLPPPPPLKPADENDPADLAQIERGGEIFVREGCGSCHVAPLTYTSPDVYDVGFRDELGNTKFNPPSLRGVGQGYSFLHDGRAKSLRSVFADHHHPPGASLTEGEITDLVRFLQSL